jgi:hypothetical protein
MKPNEKQIALIDDLINYLEFDLKGSNDINSPSHNTIMDELIYKLEDDGILNPDYVTKLEEALGLILTVIRKTK